MTSRTETVTLTERQREVAHLADAGAKVSEIADKLGVSRSRVSQVLKTVRRRRERAAAVSVRGAIGHDDPISVLDLSVRSDNALMSAGIDTIGKLCGQTRKDLLRELKNFGRKCLREVENELANHGLGIGGSSSVLEDRVAELEKQLADAKARLRAAKKLERTP